MEGRLNWPWRDQPWVGHVLASRPELGLTPGVPAVLHSGPPSAGPSTLPGRAHRDSHPCFPIPALRQRLGMRADVPPQSLRDKVHAWSGGPSAWQRAAGTGDL